jgi:cytoskeletal protein RodZ
VNIRQLALGLLVFAVVVLFSVYFFFQRVPQAPAPAQVAPETKSDEGAKDTAKKPEKAEKEEDEEEDADSEEEEEEEEPDEEEEPEPEEKPQKKKAPERKK